MADDIAPPFDPSKPSEDVAPPFDPSRPSEDIVSSWSQVPGRALHNLPSSAGSFLYNMAQPFVHPIATATALKNIGQGALQATGLLSGNEHVEDVQAIGHFLMNRYGSMDALKNTLANDPVGVAGDLSMILSGGETAAARVPGMIGEAARVAGTAGRALNPVNAALQGARAVGRGAELIGSEGLGLMTGAGPTAVRTAAGAGYEGGQAGQEFLQNVRRGVSTEDVVDDAKNALAHMRAQRGAEYRQGMANVGTDKTVLDFNDIDAAMQRANAVKMYKGQSLSPSTAGIRQDIQDTIDAWKQLDPAEYHTAEGFDALKQKIGDLRDATDFQSPERKVANEAYGAVRQAIVNQVPEYAKVMKGYEEASALTKEIERTLSLPKDSKTGPAVDTALRNLQSVLRNNVNTNYGRREELARYLINSGAPHLMEALAGQAMNSWMPRGLAQVAARLSVEGAAAALGFGAAGVPAAAIAAASLPFMSPRLMGEAAYKAGTLARPAKYVPGALKPAAIYGGTGASRIGQGNWLTDAHGRVYAGPQGPGTANADEDQPNVPRPPGQQKGGRINAQQQRFADGGAPEYDPLADPSTANAPSPERIWGPSWTQQALEQSQRDQDIIARGGNLHDLVQNSEAAQDLASGFGGGALGITKGAGAAMAAERLAMGERVPPLYSAVERAVADAKTPQAPAQQWLGTLKNAPGVKPEELETLGVEDFLKGQKGPVTKQALAEHIAENKVDVQEVTHGAGSDWIANPDPNGPPFIAGPKYETPTKFGQYTLPGGENYRELLLTLPDRSSARLMRAEADRRGYPDRIADWPDQEFAQRYRNEVTNNPDVGSENFRSSHWDEPNVLAHVRFDDRNIGGDKTLHMAEVQSDWHQKGRKEGYRQAGQTRPVNEIQRDLDGVVNELRSRGADYAPSESDWAANPDLDTRHAELAAELTAARNNAKTTGVPDAPFKTTWPELALKRMIRYAAENGYDRISWDTGVTNAERYDLSKHIDSLKWYKDGDGYRISAKKDDNIVLQKSALDEKALADHVGKEMADKIVSSDEQHGVMSGLDLKVGGEGMKAFYDRMLPNVANKLVKKYGARVEQQQIPSVKDVSEKYDLRSVGSRYVLIDRSTGNRLTNDQFSSGHAAEKWLEREGLLSTPVHSIKITPELRDQALHRGFPMFSTGIPIPPHSTDKRETQGYAKGGAVSGKATKAAAEYKTKGHPPRICANCQMFRPPSFCTAVKGQISPQAVCKFFEAKKGLASGGRIDASHTVRTGANSSADGTVYVDPRIPAKFRKFLAVHETTEQKHMAGGYARAHKIATAAERKVVEASGMSWRHYTAEMDGYLDHIEHEKDTNPPKGKLHVSAGVALGHHRSGNKS